MSGLDAQALETRTVAGKWSLHELVCHSWRVQQVFESRVEAMLTEDTPAVAPYDPDRDPEFTEMVSRAPGSVLDGFLREREKFAVRLDALSPAEWHRPGKHREFAHYDVHFQVEYMLHHEAHHIYQMFQRRAPLGKVPH